MREPSPHLQTALGMVTQVERDLYEALRDEGLEPGDAFCAARSVFRRVVLPRLAQVVVSYHVVSREPCPA